MRLSHQDSVAVDLLLDGSRVQHSESKTFVKPVGASPERLGAAESVLSLLDSMPVDEPSKDLLTRTLRRIQKSDKAAVEMPMALDDSFAGQQPVA
jgi:hypothetical protein